MITSATGFGNRKAGRRHRVGGGGGAVSGQRNSGDGEVGDAGCGHGRRPGAKCYKTFLQLLIISLRVCLWQVPFQLSQVFVGKARAYPSETPFRCSTQG